MTHSRRQWVRNCDDALLYILGAAGDDSHEAQSRANERFGGKFLRHLTSAGPLSFIPGRTPENALDSTHFGVCWGATMVMAGTRSEIMINAVVGAQHRDIGKSGKIHTRIYPSIIPHRQNHLGRRRCCGRYLACSTTVSVWTMCRDVGVEAEVLFDPPGSRLRLTPYRAGP